MKPVVTRLVVFGAAVGSLGLLAGAVMLVLRLAQPIEYPVEPSRVAQTKAPIPAPAIPVPPPAVVTPAPVAPAPVAPASSPPRPAPQTPAPPAPEPPVRALEPETTDGSAAVDWLLKGRR